MNRGIDFALSMFSYEPTPIDVLRKKYFCEPKPLDAQNQSAESTLIDEEKTPCFRVNRIDVQDRFVKQSDSFYIGIVSRGSGTVSVGDEMKAVSEGDRFFVPHQTDAVTFESETGMEIVTTFPPK